MRDRRFRLISPLVLLCIVLLAWANTACAYDAALEPYVEFLKGQDTFARDYVLGLFATHDLVILCERDHRDMTQYDLFLSIIGDERFIDEAGIVFTEIGVSTLNPELNQFLQSDALSPDSANRRVLEFQRNCSWQGLWENQNFSRFIKGLYGINQSLPPDKKIRMYPSDLPFEWSAADSAALAELHSKLGARDSVIAFQIMQEFEHLESSSNRRAKALVIMNYRHAFGKHMELPSGKIRHNVGGYLADRFGDRLANVYVNFAAVRLGSTDRDTHLGAIQGGKWDAAFKVLGVTDAGFDFRGSPFGADAFDIWPIPSRNLRYEDVFTGFVFYLPLEWIKCVVGMPGLVDSAFLPELQRRRVLERLVEGKEAGTPPDANELMRSYNRERIHTEDDLDSLTAQIDHWLR